MCEIIGDKLVGYHTFEDNLNGEMYQDFLDNELAQLLKDVSLEVRQHMRFQYDGCPPHCSVVASKVLDRDFHGHWIGRADLINWPAKSLALTSPDAFLWRYRKDKHQQRILTSGSLNQ
ncbi:hypothetical protein Trydic_g20677 [Trypoxylus dichotomus]